MKSTHIQRQCHTWCNTLCNQIFKFFSIPAQHLEFDLILFVCLFWIWSWFGSFSFIYIYVLPLEFAFALYFLVWCSPLVLCLFVVELLHIRTHAIESRPQILTIWVGFFLVVRIYRYFLQNCLTFPLLREIMHAYSSLSLGEFMYS